MPIGILQRAEARRRQALEGLDSASQAAMGQYFTPEAAAHIIASLPRLNDKGILHVLDPGAGNGILTAALVERVLSETLVVKVEVVAVEMDDALQADLAMTLADCVASAAGRVSVQQVQEDFIDYALNQARSEFDLVIQNPPYKKLPAASDTNRKLTARGIDVPNIYAAFLSLGARLLDDGGQLVSITPRSFMNGGYYKRFREDFLGRLAIDSLFTFHSRSKVFGDTGVLQEAIIVSATRGATNAEVTIHSSVDHQNEVLTRRVPYSEVVTGRFIHVPATERDAEAVTWIQRATETLATLGVNVSTGRVVDFRSRDLLFAERPRGGSPMVYPSNIRHNEVTHPSARSKATQWFFSEAAHDAKLLVPAGIYVLVKRFSAKEEKRRLVAAVWTCDEASALDNKLNFLHIGGAGLDGVLAHGLAAWINSTQVDSFFRVFSGHTQVNAGDIRGLPFPTRDELELLGAAIASTQAEIDQLMEQVLSPTGVAA